MQWVRLDIMLRCFSRRRLSVQFFNGSFTNVLTSYNLSYLVPKKIHDEYDHLKRRNCFDDGMRFIRI